MDYLMRVRTEDKSFISIGFDSMEQIRSVLKEPFLFLEDTQYSQNYMILPVSEILEAYVSYGEETNHRWKMMLF